MSLCFCGSNQSFELCCAPLLDGLKEAETAEQLMRSRFSAYCQQNYEYILRTYGDEQRKTHSLEQLEQSAVGTQWIGLKVVNHSPINENTAQVEFIAFYASENQLFQLHELSDFEKQQSVWRYTTGKMFNDCGPVKLSRNDPCPCHSGKKFKKCCLTKYSR